MPDPITAPPAAPSRSAPSTFSTLADAFIAWLTGFVTQLNAVVLAMNWNALTSTSTTSLAIGIASKSLTVDVSKSYLPGHTVKIARTSSPSNWMHGDVTSYNSGTGALVVNVTNILGSGTFTDWTITFSTPMMNLASSISDGDTTHAPDGNSVFDALALKQAKSGDGLAITAGKTITCTQDTALDEAGPMSSKLTIPGAWTTPVFNAANFTASGAMTWTVSAGNVKAYAYTIVGKTMTVVFKINASTIAGTPGYSLWITIPASKVATKEVWNGLGRITDAGVEEAGGECYTTVGGTQIYINRLGPAIFTASAAFNIAGQITFEIN